MKKLGLVVFGEDIEAENGYEMLFGDGDLKGRLQVAVQTGHEFSLEFMMIGVSASMCHYNKIKDVIEPNVACKMYFDTENNSTFLEAKRAIELCHQHGVTDLYFVSSKLHSIRCYGDLLEHAEEQNVSVSFHPVLCEVEFVGATVKDRAILEYPHRAKSDPQCVLPDHLKNVNLAKRMFALPRDIEIQENFANKLNTLFQEYGV